VISQDVIIFGGENSPRRAAIQCPSRFPSRFPLSGRDETAINPDNIYSAMNTIKYLVGLLLLSQVVAVEGARAAVGAVYEGQQGPGKGKHIVLLSGDEEYRSEEALPMLAKILAVRHGFKCTVLFAINPADGTIDPLTLTNMPGMAALDSADLCVMGLRFRELPDDQMKHFVDYLNAGKPIVALRTSTHAFKYDQNLTPNTTGTAKTGRAGLGSRSSARRGLIIMAATARKARTG
jgi:hypothetical protein